MRPAFEKAIDLELKLLGSDRLREHLRAPGGGEAREHVGALDGRRQDDADRFLADLRLQHLEHERVLDEILGIARVDEDQAGRELARDRNGVAGARALHELHGRIVSVALDNAGGRRPVGIHHEDL
jgi:hypothetical protein